MYKDNGPPNQDPSMSVIAQVVFVLAFPYSLFEQPISVQVFLSIVAFAVLLLPLVPRLVPLGTVNKVVVTPLLILCLLLGNAKKLELVVAVVAAPLALGGL